MRSMFGLGRLFRRTTGLQRKYGPVTVHGMQLRCQVCRHSEFWEHQAQLHTPFASFFDMEFVGRIAQCAVCASCGYVHWFMPTTLAPDAVEEDQHEPERRR